MRTGARKFLIYGALALLFGLRVAARAQTVPCEPSPEVKAALQSLPENTGNAEADRAARIKALRALLDRFPNDLFVHQRYQDTASSPTAKERDAVIAEYRALADKHPGSPIYAYLADRPQVGVNTKQIIPDLEKLAAAVPSVHIELVRIYQSTNFKDAPKALEHLQAFTKACPSSVRAYSYVRSLDPASDFVKQITERLRAILKESTEPDVLSYYSTLWALEFRVKPASEHEALRQQVAEDLKRLRAIDPGKNRSYYSTMQEGYKLTSDTEGGKWAIAQIQKVSPRTAHNPVMSQWREENPYPKDSDPPEKRKAWNEAQAKATAEWARQWPELSYVWYNRVNALRNVETADAADVETAGESLLKAMVTSPGEFTFMSTVAGNSGALLVADLYANKGVRLDRLPELVKQGIPELDKSTSMGTQSDLYSLPAGADDSNREYTHWYGWRTITDVWLKVKDKDRAREALSQLLAQMEKGKPKPDSKDPDQAAKQRTYMSRQVDYWGRMGDLAQLEARKIDAMTFYQNALLARPAPPPSTTKDELAEKARALWKDIGGSNEGWQAWFSRRELLGSATAAAAGVTFTKMEKPLPEFELADMSGAKWRLADLKGKTTLIGIWATW
jgi:hypothetical protein